MTINWMPDNNSETEKAGLVSHPGMNNVFRKGELTLGLILPLETHPGIPAPTMKNHVAMAQKAERLGFSALWMRDVPFYDPSYGDIGQVFEPLVYIATLAAATQSIALGTAGIVLPLREPKILAKQVASLDQLSDGRMILGLSSGDRPAEYPLFDIDFDTRGERFRDAFEVYRTVIERGFPNFSSPRFGKSSGKLDLLPKPPFGKTPAIAIGRAQQSMEWIAENMDGFIGASPATEDLGAFTEDWRRTVASVCGDDTFKPLGLGGFLDLTEDKNHPFEKIRGGVRSGSKTLAKFLYDARAAGLNHAALNPKISRRPYDDVMADLAEDVLPVLASKTMPSFS